MPRRPPTATGCPGIEHRGASRSGVDVRPAKRLDGDLRLPGDKSISHRALMLALLTDGESTIRGAGDGADVRSTAGIVAALGAEVAREPGAAGNVDYVVRSGGPGRPARAHRAARLRQLRDEPPAVRRDPRRPPGPGDAGRRHVASGPTDGPYHRTAALDGRLGRGQ